MGGTSYKGEFPRRVRVMHERIYGGCVYELSLFNSGALKLVELNFPPCAPQ